jgi:hypothetical protein
MKFSELLGEPEQEQEHQQSEQHAPPAPDGAATVGEPISVFAPVPVERPAPPAAVEYPSDPPDPVARPRTGLAEVNVRQEAEVPTEAVETSGGIAGLDEVVDDLLPSTYRRR